MWVIIHKSCALRGRRGQGMGEGGSPASTFKDQKSTKCKI
jgi:hypothetical protein